MTAQTEAWVVRELARLWVNRYGRLPKPLIVQIGNERVRFEHPAFPPAPSVTVHVPEVLLAMDHDQARTTLERVVIAAGAEALLDTGARVVSGREQLTC